MREKLLLIDGHSILHRAYYAIPNLSNSRGEHTNAVYGFLNIFFKIIKEEKPGYLAVAFDLSAPTFRHKMYREYKGSRKPMPDELREQLPMIREALLSMGVAIAEKEGYEADDILGTLASEGSGRGMDVCIFSGDRDLLQLASERIKIRIPKSGHGGTHIEDYNAKDVMERYGVTPSEYIDLKALMGDASDNIPGVPGIGEKTATALISAYKSIENAYAHADEITIRGAASKLKAHYDMAVMSKKLATIVKDVDIDCDISRSRLGDLFTPEAKKCFRRLEFKKLLALFPPETADANLSAGESPENDAGNLRSEKDLGFEENFCRLENMDAAEEFFAAFTAKQASICLFDENTVLYGIAVACGTDDGEKPAVRVYFLPCTDTLPEDYLCGKMKILAESLNILISPDIKGLIHRLGICGKGSVLSCANCRDTGAAAYLLDPLKKEYTYDAEALEYLNLSIPSKEEIFGKLKMAQAASDHRERMDKLAFCTAYTALRAADAMDERIKAAGMYELYFNIEMPLVFVLSDMEREGIRADGEALRALGLELRGEIERLEEGIYKEAGEEFNLRSPRQLAAVLFEKLGLPGGKKTKSGYSTAAEVLENLAADYPIAEEILRHRFLSKLLSTYAEGLIHCIGDDGRIHSCFKQTVTATGRLSSIEPNLQNIPVRTEEGRAIRRVFIPREGYLLVDADYSQIELRLLAHMSGDEAMIEAYRKGEDIHRMTAAEVFGISPDEVTPLERRRAKAVNFGIIYGISAFGLAKDLGISRAEAQEYIDNYFSAFPGIHAFLDGLVERARDKGYAQTLFGRRRPIPELKSKNHLQRSFGERIARNSPIQGTAADIIKIAMIRVCERMKNEGLSSKLILQVHDELLVEAKEDELDGIVRLLGEEMSGAADLRVELSVEIKSGKNWREAH